MKSLSNLFEKNKSLDDLFKKDLLLANCTYLVCSFIDFASTAFGIETGQVKELGPLIKPYISEFGKYGILIPKSIFAYSSLLFFNLANNEPILKNKIKFNSKPVLYISAAITAGTGLSWLAKKYLF